MNCLFCNGQEKNYKPGLGIEFICSRCVQLFLRANQEDLQRAHRKALNKGYTNKARALENFIVEDESDDRETKKLKRNMVRERPLRKVRPSRDQVRA